MAIVRPSEEEVRQLPPETPIMVDSDAPDNVRAIQEIEQWCRPHGLLRIQEGWLRTLRTDGKLVRRGVCYRPASDWLDDRERRLRELEQRVLASPRTASSVDLLAQD